MTFPTITFKHTHTDEARHLEDVVSSKFTAFQKYIGDESDVRCEVEFQKVTSHQSGAIFRMEANVWVAGELYRAEATAESFEKAIDMVRDDIDAEMHRVSDKHESMVRDGARKAKEMMREVE